MTDPPEGESQERRTARRQGIAYQGAVEAFVSILLAMGVGYWADQRFESSPLYLLIGLGVGFGAFVLRLVRLGRQLQRFSAESNEETRPPEHPR